MSQHLRQQQLIVDMVEAGMSPREVVTWFYGPDSTFWGGTMTPAEVERGASYVAKAVSMRPPPEPPEPASIGDERADLVEFRRGARTWRYGMEFAP